MSPIPLSWHPVVHVAFALGMVAWLAALARSDLRTRTVPVWATAAPLVSLGVLRTVIIPPDGRFWPGGLAVGSALLMLLLSDTGLAVFPAGLAAFCAGLAGPETQVLVGSWIAALVLAALGIWGAGDGKVFAVLVALFPDRGLLVTLGTTLAVGSAIALVYRHRKATFSTLIATARAALRLQFPQRTDARGTFPTVPWLALGTGVYLVAFGF